MATQYIENFIPPVQSDGLNTLTNTSLGGTLSVTGAATLASTLSVTGVATFATTATFSGVFVGGKQNIIDATANTTLTAAQSGSVVMLDAVAGVEVKLPATSPGLTYEFLVKTTPTSNTIGIRAPASSFLLGGIIAGVISGNTTATFTANGVTPTGMSMNGGTTGGSIGTVFYATAITSTIWSINGQSVGNGALATPFF